MSLVFALIGNPHHSLSMLIPDSINPGLRVHGNNCSGATSFRLTHNIPGCSVSAETQLIPMLAERRVLLRYPFNYRYTDEQGQAHDAEWIVLQPRFKATYAPAFRRQANTLAHGMNLTRHLLESGSYEIARCGRAASCSAPQHRGNRDQSGNEALAMPQSRI